jgi:hypothetical protein
MSGWMFTEHACRACMGTIMQAGASFCCAICRATSEGSPAAICGCGVTVLGPTGERSAGFRCVANPKPTPANPSHVLISTA